MLISRNFKPGFRIRLHQKDLRNALLAAESMKIPLPFTGLAQQVLISLMNNGRGDLDHSAIATFIEDTAKVEVQKPGA
jgi:2-hydroxy-3-oxopropionate reductase